MKKKNSKIQNTRNRSVAKTLVSWGLKPQLHA